MRRGKAATSGSNAMAKSRAVGRAVGSGVQTGEEDRGEGRRGAAGEWARRRGQLRPAVLARRERARAGEAGVERGREAEDVGGRAEAAVGLALLGGHVGVGADRGAQRGGLRERAGDGQVDQAGRAAHDDVARLDVEVHDALAGQVVQGGGDVQPERQDLLERERVAVGEQLVECRSVEVLEHQMGKTALGH